MRLLDLSFLLVPILSILPSGYPSSAQDSFAAHCYLTGSSMQARGEGATRYASIYWGYEVCAYYRPNQPIKVKGSDGTKFNVPKGKDIQTCIDEMRNNKTKTCE